MRYPRAYFVFDKQDVLPYEKYFQGLSNSSRSAYIQGVTKTTRSLEKEVDLIIAVDNYLNNAYKNQRDILVLSYPKIFDFLIAYFADKNLKIYWIDNKDCFERIYIANNALEELGCMDSYLYDAAHAYSNAYSYFYHLAKRSTHPHDDIIDTIQALSSGEIKTILESELRILLTSLLSINVINRFDL